MKAVKIALLLVSAVLLTNCASIAGQNTRKVKVTSKPAGAGIYVDNKRYGTTPAVITLPDYIYGGKSITLKKKGYHSETMMIGTKFQPVAILDVLFWPSIIVDGVTGNMVKIDPADLDLEATLQRA